MGPVRLDPGCLEVRPEVLRQGEPDVLRHRLDAFDLRVSERPQTFDDVANEDLGHGCARGQAHRRHAFQPGGVDLLGAIHPVGGSRTGLQRDLDQAHRVGRIRRSHHDDGVALGSHRLDRALAILSRVADVVGRRVDEVREPLPEQLDDLEGLVDRERGLGDPHDLVRIADLDRVDLLGAVDDLDVLGRLSLRALDFLVPGVPDQEDVVISLGEAHRLLVHLRHQGAGRVDREQVPGGRFGVDGGRHAVRGEHHSRALGDFLGFGDEDRPAPRQSFDDELVVDDLFAHVHGRPVQREGLLHGVDRAIHARTVPARRGHEDPAPVGRGSRRDLRRERRSPGEGGGRPV